MKVCTFAGTFDPISLGHEQVINESLKLFDKVIIGVGENSKKQPLFTLTERVSFIKKVFEKNLNVEVYPFKGMLVDFMKEHDSTIYVRGLRNEEDYKYESLMAIYNKDSYAEITTVFIPADKKFDYVSSTAIRTILQANGDVTPYLPSVIKKDVVDIYNAKNRK